jgi:two-component system cell cycle response regulator DivK
LCIEDNPDNMLLLRRVLESSGYSLRQAKKGWDGIAIAETEDVGLILLDINLPDIDGYSVARRIRASQKQALAHVPIICISANALKGDAQKALSAGCDLYMTKPIDIHELSVRVESFLPLPE